MTGAPRDLYVPAYPLTLDSGRARRTYTCIKALATLGPVDVAYVGRDGADPAPEYLAIGGVELHRIEPSRGVGRALTYARKRARGIPAQFSRGASPELIERSTALALQAGRGRVVAGDYNAATALLRLARRRPLIFNAHNILVNYPQVDFARRPWTRVAVHRFERRLLRESAEVWVVSPSDLAAARSSVPQARLRYVPNAVDVTAIRPVAQPPGDARVLMVADFTYGPNRRGATFLVDAVMPRVWAEVPEAEVLLVGRGLEAWWPPDRRVTVAGFVADLAAAYGGADCVAVPLLDGGGSPLKFIEALAFAVPAVATPFAAKGLELEAGRDYLEGADAGAFAASVVRVLRDGVPGIAPAGRRRAEAEYSVEALARRIAEAS